MNDSVEIDFQEEIFANDMSRIVKLLLVIYTSPNTLIGLLLGMLSLFTGGQVQIREGCVEFYGGFVEWFLKNIPPFSSHKGMAAMTLGHVIIGQNPSMLDLAREHEHVHVRQYEVWGPFFMPAYVAFSALLILARRDPYMENPFELEAYGKVNRGGNKSN